MRKAFVLAAVSAAAVLSAATAHAAIYTVHIDGQIIQQLTEGSDPRFAIGTPITLDTVFDSQRIVQWGDTGYSVAFLWNHSATYVIDIAGLKTYAGNDYLDGSGGWFYTDSYIHTADGIVSDHKDWLGRVGLVFQGDQIVSTLGSFAPNGDNPGIKLNSGAFGSVVQHNAAVGDPVVTTSSFSGLSIGDTFVVGANSRYYQNQYFGPEYLAQWDFDNARVTIDPVPEPAAWALMIVGFGLAGSAIRRHRAHATA